MKKFVKQSTIWKMNVRGSMDRFGNIIFIMLKIMIILMFIGLGDVQGQQYLSPQDCVNQYKVLFTKLDDNTLVAGFDTFYVEKQTMTLNWVMRSGLSEYEDQDDPIFFGNIIQLDSLLIGNALVHYVENDSAVIYNQSKPTFLIEGDWQAQIAASRINKYGTEIWSKYSDSYAFVVSSIPIEEIPFDVPVFFNLKFN